MHYAIIERGEVGNIAVADSPLADNWIELPEGVGIGWAYDGTNFHAPASPDAPVVPWTKKEFLLKFTPAEYAAISAATKTNALLDYYWQLFMVTENVLKTDPATIAGIQALEANGLLAEGRAAEILT